MVIILEIMMYKPQASLNCFSCLKNALVLSPDKYMPNRYFSNQNYVELFYDFLQECILRHKTLFCLPASLSVIAAIPEVWLNKNLIIEY